MKMHRLVIDSWPTPDGKPFKDQPEEVWQAVEDFYLGNEDGVWPSWLPESLDITEWMPQESNNGTGWEFPLKPGDLIGDFESPILNVPRVPLRQHYFSKPAAQRVLNDLEAWGVTARIETSKPVEWPTEERAGTQ